ncbi:nuclear transport factor 2 family protein [Pseudomonadota bacterium]
MKSNLDVIKALYLTFKEKDYDAFRKLCHDDISWHQNPGFPKGSSYVGADEVITNVFKAFNNDWVSWIFSIQEYYEAPNAIIVTGVYEGTHRATGKPFVSEAAHVYSFKDGKISSFQQYADTKTIWDAMV